MGRRMEGSIKMSPRHGLNPCIPVCAFCGQAKDAIALLGRLEGDAKAPMEAIMDMGPCDGCRGDWSKGVPLIRVTKADPKNGMPPLQKDGNDGLWPTAQYAVITQEAAERIFGIRHGTGRPVLIEDTAFDMFMEKAQEAE